MSGLASYHRIAGKDCALPKGCWETREAPLPPLDRSASDAAEHYVEALGDTRTRVPVFQFVNVRLLLR